MNDTIKSIRPDDKKSKIKYVVIILLITVAAAVFTWAKLHKHTESDDGISHYTCPMHPDIKDSKPGECPICHMKLVPVYKPGHGPASDGSGADQSSGLVDISPERQQLIGVRKAEVLLQEVSTEINTTGRVAFDPDLAVAIREYLDIATKDPSLRKASISRLKLLGMGDEEIRQLSARRKDYDNLYLPEGGDMVWIYATIYESEIPYVKPGFKAEIKIPYNAEMVLIGTVRSLSPNVDPVTRSLRARIELRGTKGQLRPDTFVNVILKLNLGKRLVVPRSAIVDTGESQVVYVIEDERRFEMRSIKTGPEFGDNIVVLEGLDEGELVVSSATFLVDSESRLKTNMPEHKH